nr:ABC transporter permease [Candidatus Sigynarchaeum springense]MDO8119531.1 ABC transporter permease [Candidatus Sigynarchaeota archaeon]
MRVTSLILNRLKRQKVHYALSVAGVACAVATLCVFSLFRGFYSRSISTLYPDQQGVLIVTEQGIPFYQVIPYGSQINQSSLPSIEAIEGVKQTVPALFIRAVDVENAALFTDVVMGMELYKIQAYQDLLATNLLLEGRFPNLYSREACVGIDVFGGNATIGSTIILGNGSYTVVGLLKPQSIIFNHIILADLPFVQNDFSKSGIISCAFVELYPGVDLERVKSDILALGIDLNAITSSDIEVLSSGLNIVKTLADVIFGVFIALITLFFSLLLMIKRFQNQLAEIRIQRMIGTPLHVLFSTTMLESIYIGLMGFALGTAVGIVLFLFTGFGGVEYGTYLWLLFSQTLQFLDPTILLTMLGLALASTLVAPFLLVSWIRLKGRRGKGAFLLGGGSG